MEILIILAVNLPVEASLGAVILLQQAVESSGSLVPLHLHCQVSFEARSHREDVRR